MSRNTAFRSMLFVWGLFIVTVAFVMAYGHSVVKSADLALNDAETKAYLPIVANIGVSEPDGPILISPENNAILQTLIPTFIWDMGSPSDDNPVGSCLVWGITQDELNGCYTSGGFGSTGIQQRTAFINLEPDTYYYWRVGFIYDFNYDDIYWSETRSFTTGPAGGVILLPPTYLSPVDGAAILVNEAILKWDDVAGAVEYHVTVHHVDEDRYYGWNIPNTQLDLSTMAWWGIEPGDNYEWSVSARNDYAWGDESDWWSFSILPSTNRLSNSREEGSVILRMKDSKTHMYSQD